MMFNNTQDFGLTRRVKNFTALFELGLHFNNQLLKQEQISQDCFLPLQEIEDIGRSTILSNGQCASALRFAEPRAMAFFAALACQSYIPQAICGRALRPTVAQLLCISLSEYSSAQMTYDLRRLRLKGLVERIGKSHRYRLTELGIKVVTFFTKLHRRVFQPGLSACLQEPTSFSNLAQAHSQVSTILDTWLEQKMLLPASF